MSSGFEVDVKEEKPGCKNLLGSFASVFLPVYYFIIGLGNLKWALQFLAVWFVVLAIVPSVLPGHPKTLRAC